MIKDVSSILFIMMVIVMAMSNAINVIELFTDALIDWEVVAILDPSIHIGYSGFSLILIDTISLAMTTNSKFIDNFELLLRLR